MSNALFVLYNKALLGLTIEQAAVLMGGMPASGTIDQVNWPNTYSYAPATDFRLAHDGEYLYIRFDVSGKGLRAVQTQDLQFVHEDACVEFFIGNADNSRYWNLEFNCIGTCNASNRKGRKEDSHHLTPEQLSSIQRYPSLGITPFEATDEDKAWSLTLRIPLALIEISAQDIQQDVQRRCNLYKCGDKTTAPHFVSCFPVKTENPDFHRPECFGPIIFKKKI